MVSVTGEPVGDAGEQARGVIDSRPQLQLAGDGTTGIGGRALGQDQVVHRAVRLPTHTDRPSDTFRHD
jgi:hypothetical protein